MDPSALPLSGAVAASLTTSGALASLLPLPGALASLLPLSGALASLLPLPGALASLLPLPGALASSLPPTNAFATPLEGATQTLLLGPTAWTLASVLVVSLLSLIGALSLTFGALRRHGVMMFLVALAAGTLIGDAFLHLLPEAAAHDGLTTRIAMTVIAGFLLMFILEVVLRWQHTHVELIDEQDVHGHAHDHHIAPFGWLNLIGDAVHNFLDGVIIAAAFLIDTSVGIATTLAVALHEIPQELGDFAVLVRSGMSHAKALLLNLASGLIAVVGAATVLLLDLSTEALEGVALPLIAGAFLYIAAADLIPELHHHSRRREAALILVALLVGVALMYGLLGLEAAGEAGRGHA